MKKLVAGLVVVGSIMTLTGCAVLDGVVSNIKGQLVGHHFTATICNDYGVKTGSFEADHVNIEQYKSERVDEEGKSDSSVLDITADGNEILHLGSTLIFEEKGINRAYSYMKDDMKVDDIINMSNGVDLQIQGNGGFIPIDRLVNSVKSFVGKKKVVVISSQIGTPMFVYAGNNVSVTIPKDLPKFTKITIDGKALYVHRVEYQIYDAKVFN